MPNNWTLIRSRSADNAVSGCDCLDLAAGCASATRPWATGSKPGGSDTPGKKAGGLCTHGFAIKGVGPERTGVCSQHRQSLAGYGQSNWSQIPKGHIGLQDYGGAIEFRGIKLRAVEATGK